MIEGVNSARVYRKNLHKYHNVPPAWQYNLKNLKKSSTIRAQFEHRPISDKSCFLTTIPVAQHWVSIISIWEFTNSQVPASGQLNQVLTCWFFFFFQRHQKIFLEGERHTGVWTQGFVLATQALSSRNQILGSLIHLCIFSYQNYRSGPRVSHGV
jgi:hypothetical protein